MVEAGAPFAAKVRATGRACSALTQQLPSRAKSEETSQSSHGVAVWEEVCSGETRPPPLQWRTSSATGREGGVGWGGVGG